MNKIIKISYRTRPATAIRFWNMLYGMGEITREYYYKQISKIDDAYANKELQKKQKMDKIFAEIRKFY